MQPKNSLGTIRYHLIERIGHGMTGEVFLAEATRSGEGDTEERWPVAIKVLSQKSSAPPDDLLQYEAQKLKDLGNPRVVAPVDIVQLDQPHGSWAIVMDFIPGADLARIKMLLDQQQERLSPQVVFQIAAGTLSAIAAAHEVQGRPVLHRSLNPADIRLSPTGDITVVDFSVHRRPTGVFRPPEQRGPLPAPATPEGDVYAATSIALWLLDGDGSVVSATEDAHRIDVRLTNLTSLLGTSLAGRTGTALLRVALATEPRERPSAHSLSEALADVSKSLPGEDLSAFAARLVPIAALPVPSEEGALQRLTPGPTPPRILKRQRGSSFALFGLVSTSVLSLSMVILIVTMTLWPQLMRQDSQPQIASVPLVEPAPIEPIIVVAPLVQDAPPIAEITEELPAPEPPRLPKPPAPHRPVPTLIPHVEKAHFAVNDGSQLYVDCGGRILDVNRSGRMEDFPAGKCMIKARVGENNYQKLIDVSQNAEIYCAVDNGIFTCVLK